MDASDESDRAIEPGSPSLEHVTFVILGALLTVLVVVDVIGLV